MSTCPGCGEWKSFSASQCAKCSGSRKHVGLKLFQTSIQKDGRCLYCREKEQDCKGHKLVPPRFQFANVKLVGRGRPKKLLNNEMGKVL